MARRRRGSDGLVAPNLTPLLDVVLQLITFFMMLIHFGSKLEGESQSIRLPTAPAALPGGDLGLDRLVVSVDASGTLLAEGGSYDEASASAWWADQARNRRAGRATLGAGGDEELPTLVVVRADKEATYGAVRRQLAMAQDKGFARFTLVVLKGANP
jgi:biopolymer transport protein ExbD